MGFPGSSDGKASAYNAGDPGSVPGLGRSPGEGNGYPLQYSCLENFVDRGAWQATVHGAAELGTTKQLTRRHWHPTPVLLPGKSHGQKASAYNVGDQGSIPGSGTSPGEGNGNPLKYSCLENPMDRGAYWATVHGVAKSRTRLGAFSSLLYFKQIKMK